MRRIIGLTVFVLLVGLQMLKAQSPVIQSPSSGLFPEWSSDSQLFVYEDGSKRPSDETPTSSEVFKSYPAWESFNPQTGEWHESNVWPLYPDLTNAEKATFKTNGFIYASPDGAILVYPSLKEKVTIANRATQQIFETDIDYVDPNGSPIRWSDNGQGFSVQSAGISPYVFDPIIYYVRLNNLLDLTQTQIYSVCLLRPMIAENRDFTPVETNHILDVHENQVLTIMSDLTDFGNAEFTSTEAQSHLIIWNPENPDSSVIIDAVNGDNVRAAAFVPDDAEHILIVLGNYNVDLRFVAQEGLYEYNLQTHELKYLADFAGMSNYNGPYFSPNRKWIAIEYENSDRYSFFRTSDLLAIKPLGMPTLFPTFTSYPTYTPEPIETATPAK